MGNDVSALGRLLRQHRQALGLTQAELAERAGVSIDSIGNLERGVPHLPRRETLALLIEALDLSPDERTAFTTLAATTRKARRSGSANRESTTEPQVSFAPASLVSHRLYPPVSQHVCLIPFPPPHR